MAHIGQKLRLPPVRGLGSVRGPLQGLVLFFQGVPGQFQSIPGPSQVGILFLQLLPAPSEQPRGIGRNKGHHQKPCAHNGHIQNLLGIGNGLPQGQSGIGDQLEVLQSDYAGQGQGAGGRDDKRPTSGRHDAHIGNQGRVEQGQVSPAHAPGEVNNGRIAENFQRMDTQGKRGDDLFLPDPFKKPKGRRVDQNQIKYADTDSEKSKTADHSLRIGNPAKNPHEHTGPGPHPGALQQPFVDTR